MSTAKRPATRFEASPEGPGPSSTGATAINPAALGLFVTLGNNGAGSLAVTGLLVGDKVVNVVQVTSTAGDVSSSFESVITVAGHIQQSSATDLSAKVLVLLVVRAGTPS